jgi:diguanylate cyclase (GGDEF)-like protein
VDPRFPAGCCQVQIRYPLNRSKVIVAKDGKQTLVDLIHRPADFNARYGGEEFAAILPDTDISGAVTMAEAIRSDVELPKISYAQGIPFDPVSISIR